MQLLDPSGWRTGFLDQAVPPDHRRIAVRVQAALWPAATQFFVRPRDPRMVLAYARAFGPRTVLRKVRSRQSEAVRNDAWLSITLGWMDHDGEQVGVVAVAPSAPRGAERIVVHESLVRELTGQMPEGVAQHFVLHGHQTTELGAGAVEELEALVGWRPEEGTTPVLSDPTWQAIERVLLRPPAAWRAAPARPSDSPVRETAPGGPVPEDRPTYHVFGYGQYAKVNATANLDRRLHLAGVHELNPAQLGPVSEEPGPAWDTSPMPRPGEVIQNAVVAGYHHTHVPTAVALLDAGVRHVIIEKPIATTAEQVGELLAAMDRHPEARVHCAFQRSHSPFNALLRRDLGPGPISMSATVYEVPLPPRHWYRWPVVGNAVVSNGCHWIDYFLHVNGYAEPVHLDALALTDQIVLALELANGASASISLRHAGSPRLGVRDLIQFWRGDATATIEDNARYWSEDRYRVLRRRRVSRTGATERMYAEFGRRIELDLAGDDRRAIAVSAKAVVDLAALVDEARATRSGAPA